MVGTTRDCGVNCGETKSTLSLAVPQERLESLRQSIEFMADLENPANQSSKTGEEVGNSSMDQCKDGPSPTDLSQTSQSAPNTPRYRDNFTLHLNTDNMLLVINCLESHHIWMSISDTIYIN